MLSFGWYPSVWILYADVSEHSVCSIFIGRFHLPMKMEQTECSETLAYKIQTLGNHPKESMQHSGHGESFKSRSGNFLKVSKLRGHGGWLDLTSSIPHSFHTKDAKHNSINTGDIKLQSPWVMKFFSNFARNSRYNRSSGVRASSPTTAFMACTSFPIA